MANVRLWKIGVWNEFYSLIYRLLFINFTGYYLLIISCLIYFTLVNTNILV